MDQLLASGEEISKRIEAAVERDTSGWSGSHRQSDSDIEMPEDLKKMMSRQASAEARKARHHHKARVIREAANNLGSRCPDHAREPGRCSYARCKPSMASSDGVEHGGDRRTGEPDRRG